jgi:hypothetical protein
MGIGLRDECANILVRYSGLSDGLLLLQRVKQDYAVPGKQDIQVQLFDEDGRDNFIVHESNDRDGEQSILDWMDRIKQYGVVGDVRGKPWAVCSKGYKPPYRLVSFGSVGRALYRIAKLYKEGKITDPKEVSNVKASLDAGFVDVTLWVDWVPKDVTDWLINFHNRWHDGMSTHFLALMLKAPKVECEWTAHRLLHGITARDGKNGHSCSVLCTEWLQEQKDCFDTSETFDAAKAVMKTLEKHAWLEGVRGTLRDLCQFRNPRIDSAVLIKNIHCYMTALSTHFTGSMSDHMLKLLVLEGIKFLVVSCSARLPSHLVLFTQTRPPVFRA